VALANNQTVFTWNNAFYRFGSFDFDALEGCIRQNQATLDAFRNRDIESWSSQDDGPASLFQQLCASLRIREGKAKGRRSPVAVAKAMHVLAPAFFPIWDNKIAVKYECCYNQDPCGSYLILTYLLCSDRRPNNTVDQEPLAHWATGE
jgi:hypothetical protein